MFLASLILCVRFILVDIGCRYATCCQLIFYTYCTGSCEAFPCVPKMFCFPMFYLFFFPLCLLFLILELRRTLTALLPRSQQLPYLTMSIQGIKLLFILLLTKSHFNWHSASWTRLLRARYYALGIRAKERIPRDCIVSSLALYVCKGLSGSDWLCACH